MHKLFFTLLLVLVSLPVMARSKSLVDCQTDSLIASHKVVYIDGKPSDAATQSYVDSIRQVISTFYYDQFRHFSDPAAPYFLFMSKDAGLAMGIGGAVRMRGYYDWGGAIPASGFAPYLIPITPDPTRSRQFDTTPAGTCLYFRVLGRNKLLGNYQLYIEANFNGYQARDLHLKKAYAIINDFTVGYANSTFSDPAAIPPTVDAQGPNNKISPTSVLVRYMPVVKNRWVFAVSAETPSSALDVDNQNTVSVKNWMPDWAAFVQYQWTSSEHIRIAGIVRTLSYRNIPAAKNHNIAGWGLQISSVSHPATPLTLYLSANYGKGYAGLGGDLLIGNYDLIGKPGMPGTMYAPRSFGWCAAVQYNFKQNLFMCLTASQSRYLPDGAIDPEEYKYGLFGAVNLFWNMTPRMQVGAEFDFGRRNNFNGEHRSARRIGAMCQFSF